MSKNLTNLKVTMFDDLVKAEYQAAGFAFDNTTQIRRNVIGNEVKFNLVGPGIAQKKVSQDDVPIMNPNYSRVTATLEGWVAADYTDIFDQQEVNFDEQKVLAKVIGMAIGRRKDQIVIDALDTATAGGIIAEGGTNFTYEKFLEIDEKLNASGVSMRQGRRFIAISASAARALLKEEEFTNNDFITNRILNNPTGLDQQQVMGYNFILIPDMTEGGLPKTGDIRTCFAWHEFSTGLAMGIDFRTEINYIPNKTSWLVNGIFKAGAVVIDPKGLIDINIDETK